MIQYEPFLGNLAAEFIVAMLGTLGGIAIKSLYDWLKKRYRLRHMRNVFGEMEDLRGQVRFVLPKFKPLTYDDFAEGDKSFMKKDFITNKSGTKIDDRRVPMYSECLVIDDYLAFKKIEQLFIEFGYGTLEFSDDTQALQDWRMNLILCFGGPRSNQKLRQILNQDDFQFFNLDDSGDLLSDWTLTYDTGGQKGSVNASEETAIAYIMKKRNPFHKEGIIIAIAGDSGSSTDTAARYIGENIEEISKNFQDHDFLLILKGNRDMYETFQPHVQIILDVENDVSISTES